jgi:hypothetical protein
LASKTIDFSHFRESLRYAASLLEAAANSAHDDDGHVARCREATREATLAIERHLGHLAGEGGLVEELRMNDPRLLPVLEKHEASLAQLLVDVWQFREDPPSVDRNYVERLAGLGRKAHSIANDEIDLLYESFNSPSAVD